MENDQNKNFEEIKKRNRRFYASAGVIFFSVIIGILWLANLPHLFSNSTGDTELINEDAPKKEEITNFSQVRNDLNKMMQNVEEKFEKIKNQQEKVEDVEDLLDKINVNASSSLVGAAASTSDLNILKK